MRRLVSAAVVAAAFALTLTQIASAADLPVKAALPPAPAPLIYSWTGFYVGGNIGWSWSRLSNSLSIDNGGGYFVPALIPGVEASGSGDLNDDSFTGGLQLGYNFQSGQFVYGLEGDINWMHHDASYGGRFLYTGTNAPYFHAVSSSIDWLATIRGRLGMTMGGNGSTLVYVTGGLALTKIKFNQAFSEPPFTTVPPAIPDSASISNVKAGWTAGAGLETMLTDHWTARAEYLFAQFDPGGAAGTFTSIPPLPASATITNSLSHLNIHTARFGVNYKF